MDNNGNRVVEEPTIISFDDSNNIPNDNIIDSIPMASPDIVPGTVDTNSNLDSNVSVENTENSEILDDKGKKKKEKKEKKKKKRHDDEVETVDEDKDKVFKIKAGKNDISDDKTKVICIFPKKMFDLVSFLVIVILASCIVYLQLDHKRTLEELDYACTPINSFTEKPLDVNSTLVQGLYKKYKTSINEDYAQPEWDNTMMLYLAYRQLQDSDFYTSNCNLYKNENMEPYKCDAKGFTPRAFKVSSLVLEWKRLFGEDTPIQLDNIKLKNSCIGGFQYIAERDEFVEGYCSQKKANSFKVTKTLKEASTNGNVIVIKESVRYHENEKMIKPEYLKSGVYVYTFRLDMNYNYVLVSKVLENNY